MLKNWHKQDVFKSLNARGWEGLEKLVVSGEQLRYVGEAYSFSRGNEIIRLYFVADFGTGFEGTESIESVVASRDGDSRLMDLWLHRRRASKWRTELMDWVSHVSDRSVGEHETDLVQPR
jgi:hypothetical protein